MMAVTMSSSGVPWTRGKNRKTRQRGCWRLAVLDVGGGFQCSCSCDVSYVDGWSWLAVSGGPPVTRPQQGDDPLRGQCAGSLLWLPLHAATAARCPRRRWLHARGRMAGRETDRGAILLLRLRERGGYS